MTTRIATTDAHEGPVFVAAENALYFTSLPHRNGGPPIVAIKRVDVASGRVSIVRPESNVANGMTLDPDGCLLDERRTGVDVRRRTRRGRGRGGRVAEARRRAGRRGRRHERRADLPL